MGSGKGKKAEDKLAPQDKLQIEMSIWNNKYLSMLALKTETKSSCLQRRKRLRNKRQRGFPDGASGKEPACQCRRHKRLWVLSRGWEDPLEEEMATHSSILGLETPMDREVSS